MLYSPASFCFDFIHFAFNFTFKSYFPVWKFIFDQTKTGAPLTGPSLQLPPASRAAGQRMESTQPSRCGPRLGRVWSHDDNCSLDGATVTEQESAEASVTTCYQWSKVHTHTGHVMTTVYLYFSQRKQIEQNTNFLFFLFSFLFPFFPIFVVCFLFTRIIQPASFLLVSYIAALQKKTDIFPQVPACYEWHPCLLFNLRGWNGAGAFCHIISTLTQKLRVKGQCSNPFSCFTASWCRCTENGQERQNNGSRVQINNDVWRHWSLFNNKSTWAADSN